LRRLQSAGRRIFCSNKQNIDCSHYYQAKNFSDKLHYPIDEKMDISKDLKYGLTKRKFCICNNPYSAQENTKNSGEKAEQAVKFFTFTRPSLVERKFLLSHWQR